MVPLVFVLVSSWRFLPYGWIVQAARIERLPRWLFCSPLSLLWLIPLTMLPQSWMAAGNFGPDPSIGLLPIPGVFVVLRDLFLFRCRPTGIWMTWTGQLGRHWYLSLPMALLIVFSHRARSNFEDVRNPARTLPDVSTRAMVSNCLQATFAWLMLFGSIGLFRRLLSRENPTMRYLSDSSYWLYLIHLPLVLLAQWLVRDLQVAAFVKFSGIVIVISGLLLLTYEYGVRYTAIGRLLNGPRTRLRA